MPRTKKRKEEELSEWRIETLVHTICHSQEEEETRAQALLILIDEIERESGHSNASEIVKRAAFMKCCDETMAAHIQLVRSELPAA